MIINEKYIQDIDDEDEDDVISNEISNIPNIYDFEVVMEYRQEI